jgi:ubiquinone/menaquinone biosynthesis C-methylase UbiE
MEESSFLNPTKVLVSAGVHEGLKVADFGAGSGFFSRAAARLVGEAGVVWAVDAHQAMLPRLKNLSLGEGLTNIEVVHGNVEVAGGSHLPLDGFDFVIAANLFFGVADKLTVVKEIQRVLRRGGRALVIDWQDSFGGLGPHPEHVVNERDLQKLFEEAGFTIVNEVSAGEYHWGFIAKKRT